MSPIALLVLAAACNPGNQYWKFQRDIEYDYQGELPFAEGWFCGELDFRRNIDYEGDGETFHEMDLLSTCWEVWEPEPGRIAMLQRVAHPDRDDGFCRFEGAQDGAGIVQVDSGDCRWDNGTSQVRVDLHPGGTFDIGNDRDLNGALTFDSLDLEGDQVQLGSDGVYDFDNVYRAGELGDLANLLQEPECALDGCWAATLTGTVVAGPATCSDSVDTWLPSTSPVQLAVSDGGSVVTLADDTALPGFADLFTCDVYATTGEHPTDQWRYRLSDDGAAVTLSARYFAEGCEVLYTGEASTCAR